MHVYNYRPDKSRDVELGNRKFFEQTGIKKSHHYTLSSPRYDIHNITQSVMYAHRREHPAGLSQDVRKIPLTLCASNSSRLFHSPPYNHITISQ